MAMAAHLIQAYGDWMAEMRGVAEAPRWSAPDLSALPGPYAPPGGVLLLARGRDGSGLGCAAMRAFDDRPHLYTGLIKRLYVVPEARGQGHGRRLAAALIETGRAAGFARLLLSTLPEMPEAQALYGALGFREIPPYTSALIPGRIAMALELRPDADGRAEAG
ncbi:MAG: GNAT family N-acetyltransferase [Pseudomonadota bacterium]